MVVYRGRFRGTPASVRVARQAVLDHARACGFCADELADIGLAAGEALANAVEHGARDLGYIDVRCEFDGGRLSIEIGDTGAGFDVFRATSRHPDPSGVRGFGITIMRSVMDDVRYSRHGSVVRLVKRRVSRDAASREEA